MIRTTGIAAVGMRIDADAEDDLLGLPTGYVKQRVLEHKLVVLRGFRPLSRDQFHAFARCFEPGGARLLEWPGGPIMDVAVDDAAVNYLFSREAVPLHWDGFFDREPSYLFFQCVRAPREGGATRFVDAAKVWDLADPERRSAWTRIELTYHTEKKAHYGGTIALPLVRRHPVTGRQTLRYAEPVDTLLNPLSVTCDQLDPDERTALVRDFEARLSDSRVQYQHVWRDGDIVIGDNQALLHGRTAIEGDGGRHLRRIQLV